MPSKAFGIMLGDSRFDLVEKQKLFRLVIFFSKSDKRDKILKFSHKIEIKISYVVLVFHNFWSYRSIRSFRLLQTVLFLTDSVFFALCAYLDESMIFIGGYKPW